MKKLKDYFRLTLVISVLFGILLPLAMGVKNLYSIALVFTLIWFIYAVLMLVTTFLGRERLKIKVIHRKHPTVVRFELPNSRRKE